MNQQMNQQDKQQPAPAEPRGINRTGLDAAFTAAEVQKSQLLLTAQLLWAERREEAAEKCAEAARIEERLSAACEQAGLPEKAFVHCFSAASCWAQAGNFYRAIALCAQLLARAELPERLRARVDAYEQTLRRRRAQWYEQVMAEALAG